jgi:hypothetical protein
MIKLQSRLMPVAIGALFVVLQLGAHAVPSAVTINPGYKNPWWIPAPVRQTVVKEQNYLYHGGLGKLHWLVTPWKTAEDPAYMHVKSMIDRQFRNHTLQSHYKSYENEYADASTNPIVFFKWAYATYALAVSESPHHYAYHQTNLIFAAFTTLPSPHVRAYDALRLICAPGYIWMLYHLTKSPNTVPPFPPQGLQLAWSYRDWPQLLTAICLDYHNNLKYNRRLVQLIDSLKPVYGRTIWYKEALADLYYVQVNGQMTITPRPSATVARFTVALYNEAIKERKDDPEEVERENTMRDPNNIGFDVTYVYGVYVKYPTIAPSNYKVPKGALPLSAYKKLGYFKLPGG